MKGKIFNAQEVQAMLNGSKVMFREVAKGLFLANCAKDNGHESKICDNTFSMRNAGMKCCGCNNEIIAKCPYRVKQKIFCKEQWIPDPSDCEEMVLEEKYLTSEPANKLSQIPASLKNSRNVIYKTASSHPECIRWRSGQSMPQWASRLTLQIKSIGVERLQEISRSDCSSEGEDQWSFICNWNATHKKPEEKFEANPWVWCVSFEVINN